MSNLEIINDDKNQPTKGYIRGTTLCYIKLQEGSLKYNSKTEYEYTVDAVVDKATAKSFKKMFAKNTPKEVDTPEFKDKFKIEPVYPEADEQFIIKLKAKASVTKDLPKHGLVEGDRVPYEWSSRPKLLVPVEGGVEDVTMTMLAANGSVGDISFNITCNDFGTFPQLTGILVTSMIEYESKGGGSAFGDVVGGYNAGNGETQQKAITQEDTPAPSTPAPLSTTSGVDAFDDDIVF